jgi:allophanate hydrolase subunit 2
MAGTVIAADMDLVGRLQPNTPVRFVKTGINEALAARQARAGPLAKLCSSPA